MALSRKTVRAAAGTVALSGPGTRPALVEVKVFHAKLGQGKARLLVGQVFNDDSDYIRVMRTQ